MKPACIKENIFKVLRLFGYACCFFNTIIEKFFSFDRYKERSEIEALLFSIQTKMKALGQPLYIPPEGQLVQDIERAWDELEKAEHRREVALREELLRQEKLENLAYRFERKVCCG